MSSHLQIAANRANSQLSTGPKTSDGKARSSINALKTGLTGRTVLLPGDDLVAYQALLEQITAQYRPGSPEEKMLVGKIVDTEWRLLRIPELIEGVQLLGHRELAPQIAEEFKDETEGVRASLLRTRVYLVYRKELSNLSLQESRLRRQREKDLAELEALQQPRTSQQKTDLYHAMQAHVKKPAEFTRDYFRENGFEFSDEDWQNQLFKESSRSSSGNYLVDRITFRNRFRKGASS